MRRLSNNASRACTVVHRIITLVRAVHRPPDKIARSAFPNIGRELEEKRQKEREITTNITYFLLYSFSDVISYPGGLLSLYLDSRKCRDISNLKIIFCSGSNGGCGGAGDIRSEFLNRTSRATRYYASRSLSSLSNSRISRSHRAHRKSLKIQRRHELARVEYRRYVFVKIGRIDARANDESRILDRARCSSWSDRHPC